MAVVDDARKAKLLALADDLFGEEAPVTNKKPPASRPTRIKNEPEKEVKRNHSDVTSESKLVETAKYVDKVADQMAAKGRNKAKPNGTKNGHRPPEQNVSQPVYRTEPSERRNEGKVIRENTRKPQINNIKPEPVIHKSAESQESELEKLIRQRTEATNKMILNTTARNSYSGEREPVLSRPIKENAKETKLPKKEKKQNSKQTKVATNHDQPKQEIAISDETRKKAKESKAQKAAKKLKMAEKKKEMATVLTNLAEQRISENNHQSALKLLDQAIDINQKDVYLISTRSYCHNILSNYSLALKDANRSIRQDERHVDGYLEKAKALIGLEKFKEAQRALDLPLSVQPDNYEAIKLLNEAKALQTKSPHSSKNKSQNGSRDVSKGAERKNSAPRVEQFDGLVQITNQVSPVPFSNVLPKAFSDAKDSKVEKGIGKVEQNAETESCPTNIFNYTGLIVIGMDSKGKKEKVQVRARALFEQFGKITNIATFKNGSCLITFDNCDSPRYAIEKYHVSDLAPKENGQPLVLRFTAGFNQKLPNGDRKWTSDECYHWRTTGCDTSLRQCTKRHVPVCKGVDFQDWMMEDIWF
ncbi:Stress-induced-phosphoprotein 1 [Halotydeus destructor]|nr:Stress-induced-phosphoprotein 1 [Halotydeus destructor]